MGTKRGGRRAGAGRKPIPRAPNEKIISISITLTESDIAYLQSINPRNLSDAIRQLIAQSRSL